MEGRKMNDRYKEILNKVKLQYPRVDFTITKEYKGINFVYGDMNLIEDKDFFSFVCDVAYDYLRDEELNMFSIVYDYYSELLTNNITTEINNTSHYICKSNSSDFTFDFIFTQSAIDANEGGICSMSKDIKSILKFNNYVVEKVEFYRNSKCTDKGFDVKLDIQRNTKYIPDENKGFVTVRTKIFDDPIKNNYPFSIEVVIIGEFEIESEDQLQVEKLLEINAVAILFPYIRALITTYTANANVQPLILPPINVMKLVNNDLKDARDRFNGLVASFFM